MRVETDVLLPPYLQNIARILDDESEQRKAVSTKETESTVLRDIADIISMIDYRFGMREPVVIQAQEIEEVIETPKGLAVAKRVDDVTDMVVVLDRWEQHLGSSQNGSVFNGDGNDHLLMVYEGAPYAMSAMSRANPHREVFVDRYKKVLPLSDDLLRGIRFTGRIAYEADGKTTFSYEPRFVPPAVTDIVAYQRRQMQFARNYLLANGDRKPLISEVLARGRMVR